MSKRYSPEIKAAARSLYLKRMTPQEIAHELNLPAARIIYYWAEKGGWQSQLSVEMVEDAISRRIVLLTTKDGKTEMENNELDRLVGHHIKLIIQRDKHAEKMAQLQLDDAKQRNGAQEEKKERKRRANDVTGITADSFKEFVDKKLFGYQKIIRDAKKHRIRNILKSRQVGLTWYFAFEAFEDAVLNGESQAFLSASRAQAELFRSYIIRFASELLDLKLTGNPITLSNGAQLTFLSTNASTAQGSSANIYVDEIFWIPDFTRVSSVVSATATHKKFRKTYFSTPSSKAHQAYPFWTGDTWKKGNKSRENIIFPDEAQMRDGGVLCPDKQWRYIVTLEDACQMGLEKHVDIDELREENSVDAFNMLYMCQFVDDKDSVFSFSKVESCGADPATWEDFDPAAARPFGNRETWAGYDPSRTGDNATFVVLAVPVLAVERYRVLQRWSWRGMSFRWQAEQIKKIKGQYHMTFIGIDVTGIGRGVYERVEEFAQREVRAITYNVETKNRLVLKMIDLVDGNRIEWDEGQLDIAASFMTIRRTVTASGNAMTFVATRTESTGHADVFFAIAHAVDNEPLNYDKKRKSTWSFSN
ncbi:terminase large subunit domain-containing protein [Enterobacter ludwigii]|uniref:terminase large subunit domain-containing protein n=1 Tax=Enterobacter ludwigii TaxID=299767 RepID=UPI0006433472|nr:terminase family protein [Enterobacter ludwigii]KLP41771.1 terminase [Enterobacter ludwigii]